jgi:hypothetical protein
VITGANRHDMKKLADLLDGIVFTPALPDTINLVLCTCW